MNPRNLARMSFFIITVALMAGAPRQAASQPSAPYSSGYAAKISARTKANIDFKEDIVGSSPRALVQLRTDPTGVITQYKLLKTSGSEPWDTAVLRAIARTGTIPRDIDGRVPAIFEIEFRPRD